MMSLLLLASIAQPINVLDYGETLPQALDAAQQSAACASDAPCPMYVPRGVYAVDAPLVVCRPVDLDLRGVVVNTSTDGLMVLRGQSCVALGRPNGNSERSTIRGGWIRGNAAVSDPMRTTGVVVGATAHIQGTRVSEFHRGVSIDCDTRSRPNEVTRDEHGLVSFFSAHCNGWSLDNVWVNSNLLDGVWVRGADANAGSISRSNSMVNCKAASRLLPGTPNLDNPLQGEVCANFYLGSQFGTTLVGNHSSHARDDVESQPWFQVLHTGLSGANAIVGMYTEGTSTHVGNGVSWLSGPKNTVLGGTNQIQAAKGMIIRGETINRSCFGSNGGDLEMCAGDIDETGSPLVVREVAATNKAIRIKKKPAGWEFEYGLPSQNRLGFLSMDDGSWLSLQRTILPACTSTTGVTWSSPSGLVVREDANGMSVCDGSE